jgi:hypothetical protein
MITPLIFWCFCLLALSFSLTISSTIAITNIAFSVDTGEIHLLISSSSFLNRVSQKKLRGLIFQWETFNDIRILCASANLSFSYATTDIAGNMPGAWCTDVGVFVEMRPQNPTSSNSFCICMTPIIKDNIDSSINNIDDVEYVEYVEYADNVDNVDNERNSTGNSITIIGRLNDQHDITRDTIAAIVSRQTQLIEAWSLDQYGPHPPVDRVPCCPSTDVLWNTWFKRGLPVIIEGMVSKWNAVHTWTNSFFRQKYGNVPIYVRNPHDPEASVKDNMKLQTTIEDYMDFLDDDTVSSTQPQNHMVGMLNTFHSKIFRPLLQHDIIYEEAYFEQMPHDVDTYWNSGNTPLPWMGPRGTHTPLHHDVRSSFNCQIRGSKRWQLVHARQRNLLYLLPTMKNYCMVNQDERRLDEVDLARYPLFERATVWNITNNPGEALLLPGGLFHDVVCESKNCMTISLYNFHHDMMIKEHRWMSETIAIGHTITLAKHLTMGTECGHGGDQNEPSNEICPTPESAQVFVESERMKPLPRTCAQALWTIVNSAPYRVQIVDVQGNHVLSLEGRTAANLPLTFSESAAFIVYLDHGTTVGVLSKRHACTESSVRSIVRSIIQPCQMSSTLIAAKFLEQMFQGEMLNMQRLPQTGLYISTVGLFVPLQGMKYDIRPIDLIRQAISIGINQFHLDLHNIVKKNMVELHDVFGEEHGERDSMVLICYVTKSTSFKSMITTLIRGTRLVGTTYCDVVVIEHENEATSCTHDMHTCSSQHKSYMMHDNNMEWLFEQELALYIGRTTLTKSSTMSSWKSTSISIISEFVGDASKNILVADVVQGLHMGIEM